MSLLHQVALENGLEVRFLDCSNRYYGDYWRVKVEVRCSLELHPGLFAGEADPQGACEAARRLLSERVEFSRSLEKMGVEGAALAAARSALVEGFIQSAFPYLRAASFPPRLVARELAQRRKKRSPFRLLP